MPGPCPLGRKLVGFSALPMVGTTFARCRVRIARQIDATHLEGSDMIETLEIRNYRSCVDTSLVLQSDLSVLIGPNGSGKTNVLNAILLLKKLVDERFDPFTSKPEPPSPDEAHVKVCFRFE